MACIMTYEGRRVYMYAIGVVVIPMCCKKLGHHALRKRFIQSMI